MAALKVVTSRRRWMMVEFSTTKSIREIKTGSLSAPSAISSLEPEQCRLVTSTLFRSRLLLPVTEQCLHMRCWNRQRLTSPNSNTTIAITLGFHACFAIVARTTRRNRPCPAKLHMHLARVVTHSSLQIRQVGSAQSVTRTFRAERSKRFRRCVASTRGSITRNMRARLARRVTGEIVVVLDSRFLRD